MLQVNFIIIYLIHKILVLFFSQHIIEEEKNILKNERQLKM